MLADHRAACARAVIAGPSLAPVAARREGPAIGIDLGMTVVFVALTVAIRIGADTVAHGYQPFLERIIQFPG
jgi:hypothetical protein